MNPYIVGGALVFGGSCILSVVVGKLIANAPYMVTGDEPATHPPRRARDEQGRILPVSPARRAAQAGPFSERVIVVFDWATLERVDRDHRFLHVSLRTGATKVSICSCGWESRRFANSDLAVEDWKVHREFLSMVGAMQ